MQGLFVVAAVASTFNLTCLNKMATYVGLERKGEESRYTQIYRIDLARGRWCAGDCTETMPIAAVTNEELTLEIPANGDPLRSIMTKINRESGAFSQYVRLSSGAIIVTGTCEAAPFTGFPARKF